jgi:histidinol dehydrogenase
MGQIIKDRALDLKGLLEKIRANGDNPPQDLAMEFQGKTQEMQFLQNAFSTALNAIGDTIKKALEQAR